MKDDFDAANGNPIAVAELARLHETAVVVTGAEGAAKIDEPILTGVLSVNRGVTPGNILRQLLHYIARRATEAAHAVDWNAASVGQFGPDWRRMIGRHGRLIAQDIRDEKRAIRGVWLLAVARCLSAARRR